LDWLYQRLGWLDAEIGVEMMSDSKFRGRVHLVEETKTFGQKGFRKRLVVLEQDNGRFPNFIPVEFLQEACDQVSSLNVGDEIEVSYRLSGRRWQKDPNSEAKYFLSCEAISYRLVGGTVSGGDFATAGANEDLAEAAYEDDGDVPF
jgi:hypothetical protein